jgi:glycosyltransferase involved in cell wall biosynthesis
MLVENLLSKRTDGVVAVSQSEANEIVSALPALTDRLVIIPNIVDCTAVREGAQEEIKEPLKSFLDKRAGSFLVTMIARNDPIKNHRLAFDACRIVLSGCRDVTVVFVGIDYRDRSLASLHEDFPDSVAAIPSLENALPLIKRSTLLMLTSRREGSPLVLLEGLCLGKPAVGTNVPGIRDVIRDQETGILCDQSASALADAIGKIINDPVFREALGRRAAESVSMTVRGWTDRYLGVYHGGSGWGDG